MVANTCNNIKDFLRRGDAKCGEWAKIFNDMIRLQGIQGSRVTLVTYGIEQGDHGFLSYNDQIRLKNDIKLFFGADSSRVIANYLPNAPVGYRDAPVTFLFVKNQTFPSNTQHFYLYDQTTSVVPDTIAATGKILRGTDTGRIAAQGENNFDSPGDFLNHTIVEYNGQYFDASYGTAGMAEIPWESSGLAGFGVRLLYAKPGNSTQIEIMWISELDNPQTQQTTFKFN